MREEGREVAGHPDNRATSTARVPTLLVPARCSCSAAITSSLCPSPIQGQLSEHCRSGLVKLHLLPQHSPKLSIGRGRRGADRTTPLLLPHCCTADFPVGQSMTPAPSRSCQWDQRTALYAHLSSEWSDVRITSCNKRPN